MPFSISLLDRYYEVNWMMADEPFVTIVFPAQYDLLLGLEKDKASRQFKDAIQAAPQRSEVVMAPSNLEQMDDSLFQSKSDTLELASLTDAIYYKRCARLIILSLTMTI